MYRQIVSMQIHRMIMLTRALLRANFSIIFSHHSALIGGKQKEKKQDAQKKKILTRGSWGPSPPTLPSYPLRRGIKLLPKSNCRGKHKVGLVLVSPLRRIPKGMDGSAYACSSHHNPAGEYRIFCYILVMKWVIQQQVWCCNLLHNIRVNKMLLIVCKNVNVKTKVTSSSMYW